MLRSHGGGEERGGQDTTVFVFLTTHTNAQLICGIVGGAEEEAAYLGEGAGVCGLLCLDRTNSRQFLDAF